MAPPDPACAGEGCEGASAARWLQGNPAVTRRLSLPCLRDKAVSVRSLLGGQALHGSSVSPKSSSWRTCLLQVGPQHWRAPVWLQPFTPGSRFPASPHIPLFPLSPCPVTQVSMCAFLLFLPDYLCIFLRALVEQEFSAVCSENCPTCRCIFDVFIKGGGASHPHALPSRSESLRPMISYN